MISDLMGIKSRPFLFLVIFTIVYLSLSVVVWIVNVSVPDYKSKASKLRSYVYNHPSQIKEDVFQSLFAQAQNCNLLQVGDDVDKCQAKIARQLADTLKEEEIASYEDDWSPDLFFVKQTGNNFYRLGWGGKLENISDQVNKTLLDIKLPLLIKLLTHNCNYFQPDSSWSSISCEVYEKVPLSITESGYMVRIHALSEEDDFWFAFFMPIFSPLFLFLQLGGSLILSFLLYKKIH